MEQYICLNEVKEACKNVPCACTSKHDSTDTKYGPNEETLDMLVTMYVAEEKPEKAKEICDRFKKSYNLEPTKQKVHLNTDGS